MPSSLSLKPNNQPAVFLDRDGTLNKEIGYIREVAKLELIPGAAAAVKALNDAGILAILTTNQSGVARGFYDETHIHALHKRLEMLLLDESGAKLDAIYYCPYHERGAVPEYAQVSPLRKPDIGMITLATEQFPQINLKQSYVFGDKATDIDMAVNAGCQGVLLKTGYGERVLAGKYQVLNNTPDYVATDVSEGVKWVLQRVSSAVAHS